MKETGLMFKAPLVRDILSDQKTQTRRIAKLPHMNPLGEWELTTVGGPGGGRTGRGNEIPLQVAIAHTRTGEVICAPIQPGDRIYVRETWRGVVNIAPPGSYEYAVARYVPDQEHCRRVEYAATQEADGEPWRPAIHMPKWAARIWLEVTGVRVERLQSISRGDAMAEGCPFPNMADGADPRKWFAEVWDSTTGRPALPKNENSKRYVRVKHWLDTHPDTTGWAANPWVWVIDFKRIEKP